MTGEEFSPATPERRSSAAHQTRHCPPPRDQNQAALALAAAPPELASTFSSHHTYTCIQRLNNAAAELDALAAGRRGQRWQSTAVVNASRRPPPSTPASGRCSLPAAYQPASAKIDDQVYIFSI